MLLENVSFTIDRTGNLDLSEEFKANLELWRDYVELSKLQARVKVYLSVEKMEAARPVWL